MPVAILFVCGGTAHAADSSPALEEIIVTAQKRAESILDVPISVSVVGADEIANQHITDTGDLTRAVPDFSNASYGNPGGSSLEMRGISSAAGASTIAVYLDDAPITARTRFASLGQPEPMLFDINQIEVLRGPQGTLYGASAEGGLLKYRFNSVDLHDFNGSVSSDVSITKFGGIDGGGSAVINAPIIDGVVGIRLGAASSYDSGYINRYSPDTGALLDRGVNGHHSNAARLALEIDPSDALRITPSLFYQDSSYGSTDTITLGLPKYSTNNRAGDGGSDRMIVPSLTVRYDIGSIDLTAVTTNYTRRTPFSYDGTVFNSVYIGECILDGNCGGLPILDLHGNLSGNQIAVLPAPALDQYSARQFSQELRLESKPYAGSGVPLTWTAGVYFGDTGTTARDTEYIDNFNSVFTSLYGASALDSTFGGPLPGNVIFAFANVFREREYSAFGDLTYYVTPVLRLSAGMRYLEARQSIDETGYGFFFQGGTNAASKDHAMTPKVSATYEFSKDISAYATASKGFRLGGPNDAIPVSFCAGDLAALGLKQAPESYEHDELWNYELGLKTRPTPELAINASVYYIKWNRLQQQFTLPTCGFVFSNNVGTARSYGSELEITYKPIAELMLRLAGSYTNAVLTEPVAALDIQSGTRVEGVPTSSGSASAEYSAPLNAKAGWFVRTNYNYTGDSHGSLIPTDSDFDRPAYGVAGASVGVDIMKLEISAYVKNVFDNQTIIQSPDHATVPVGLTLRPRVLGLAFTGKF